MSFATTTVEVAFASAPLGGSYTWVDITDYVKGFNTKRGRDYELDQIQAGTASIILSNADGRFTPGLASSPYYPNVRPRRRVRIRSTDPLGSGGSSITQPAIDTTTTATASSATSITWNHTVGTGSNRLLVVDIGFTANSDEVGTLTFGGVALTKAGSDQSGTGGTDRRFERWYLVNPASGTGSIVATLYNAATHLPSGVTVTTIAAASTSLVNVDQTTPVGTSVIAHGSANTTGSLAPTTLTNDLVMTGVMARTTVAETGSGTSTSGSLLAGTNNYLAYGTGNGATSWSWTTADNFGAVATPVHGVTVVTSAITTVFTGFVESWQQSFVGGGPEDSEVNMTAVDGFKVLGQTELLSPYAAQVLSDGAFAYYPLGESDTATKAVEYTGTYDPAVPQVNLASTTPDTYSFGHDSVLSSADGTGLTLENFTGNSRLPSLQVGTGAARQPVLGTTGSVEFWYKVSPHGTAGNFHLFSAKPGTLPLNGVPQGAAGLELYCPTAGSELQLYAADGTLTRTLDRVAYNFPGGSTFIDGKAHQFVIAWSPSGIDLYVDGLLVGTDGSTVGWPLGDLSVIYVGGVATGPRWYSGGSGFDGIVQGLAFFNSRLTATQVANQYKSGLGGSGEDELSRMVRILDLTGWPSSDRLFDAGLSGLSIVNWSVGTNALSLLQGYASDAGGYVFTNGAGQITYHNRWHRLNQASRFTFQESTGTGIEGDAQFHMDDSNVRNKVSVSTPNGSVQAVSDSASIASYGTVADSLTLNVISTGEALDAATWRVALYKDPHVRCDTLTIEPVTSDALWLPALGLEIGDRITVAGLPASAPASSVSFIVEAIKHTATAGGLTPSWSTSLQLSPDLPFQGLTLDDNTFGILDTDCLVY